MDEQLKLYVVRHGETEWSISGQHTGTTDVPLTARGENQARALAAVMRKISFTHVLSSPRKRALRTCELAGFTPEIHQDLAEWNYGTYEGQRSVDIRKSRPTWDVWSDGCPGGETPADVATRADRVIAHLSTLQGNIALFTHGHFGCALATRWIGLAIAEGQHFLLDPASLGTLGYAPRHSHVRTISAWNLSAADS